MSLYGFSFMLKCTACGREYPLEKHLQRCEKCNEPLEVEIVRGAPKNGKSVWERYREFYSYTDLDMKYSLGEGDTPLIKMENLSYGENEVYVKNETTNPTWSFKDRGTFVALNRAKNLGFDKIGVVSTGNMASSVAAYGSRAGMKTYVLVSSFIPEEKLAQISIYGARIFKVRGDYGALYFKSLELGARMGIYFMNSDDPFRVEGYKSIAFEIGENVEADYVLVPTSSGGLFRGIYKGFVELKESGLIDKIPEMVAVQAEGCSPICRAFKERRSKIKKFENPHTIAHAIENPYPPSGNAVLRILKERGWKCIAVDDEGIINAQRLLARDGVFVQPASATSFAAFKKLKLKNKRVVLILTGSGLKTKGIGHIKAIPTCDIENLERCMEGKE
jgi:threonine synthase